MFHCLLLQATATAIYFPKVGTIFSACEMRTSLIILLFSRIIPVYFQLPPAANCHHGIAIWFICSFAERRIQLCDWASVGRSWLAKNDGFIIKMARQWTTRLASRFMGASVRGWPWPVATRVWIKLGTRNLASYSPINQWKHSHDSSAKQKFIRWTARWALWMVRTGCRFVGSPWLCAMNYGRQPLCFVRKERIQSK